MNRIPFDPAELESKGFYPGRFNPTPILNTPITPKENLMMLLRGEKPLWVPLHSDMVSLTPSIMKDPVSRGFVFESGEFDPDKDGGGPDMFGVEWEWGPTVTLHGSPRQPQGS